MAINVDGVTGQLMQKTNRVVLNMTLGQLSHHYAPISVKPKGGGSVMCVGLLTFSLKHSNSPPPGENNGSKSPSKQVKVVKCPAYNQNHYPVDRPHNQISIVSPTPFPFHLIELNIDRWITITVVKPPKPVGFTRKLKQNT